MSQRRVGNLSWRVAVLTVLLAVCSGLIAPPKHASAFASSAYINAPTLQMQHPLDCEATALQISLAALGINRTQDWVLSQFGADLRGSVVRNGVPAQWGDPYQTFVGNVNASIWNWTGYGVYYPPVVRAAESAGAIAYGQEGWNPQQLYAQIAAGNPVVIWVPHLLEPVSVGTWTAWDGRQVWFSPQDHAQVLVGYDMNAGTVAIDDDYDGRIHSFSMSLFEQRFAAFHSSAVVLEHPPAAGDFNGDKNADIAQPSQSSVSVLSSSGGGFTQVQGSGSAFYGNITTLAGDVTGTGKQSLIAVNQGGVWVLPPGSGNSFGSATEWSSVPFYGDRTTLVADVDGDGKADLVAVNSGSVWVMLSTGGGFSSPVEWSAVPFYGNIATLAGNLTGQPGDDLIAINSGSTWVLHSNKTRFEQPVEWSAVPFYGDRTTLAADVNKDGKADLIAVDSGSVWVMTTGAGGGFSSPAEWSAVPFYGEFETFAGDVNGDGYADLIAQNDQTTWVITGTGSGFNQPMQWSDHGAA